MSSSLTSLLSHQPSAPSFLFEVEAPSTSASVACLCRPRDSNASFLLPSAQGRRNYLHSTTSRAGAARARSHSRALTERLSPLPHFQLNTLQATLELPGRNWHGSAHNASVLPHQRPGCRVQAAAGPPRHSASSIHVAASFAFKGTSAWGPPNMSAPGQQNLKGTGGLPDDVSSLQSEFWRQQQLASLEKASQLSQEAREKLGVWEGEVRSVSPSDVQLIQQDQGEEDVPSAEDIATSLPDTSGFTNQEPELKAEAEAEKAEPTPLAQGVNGYPVNGVAKELEGHLGGSNPEAQEIQELQEAQEVQFRAVLEEGDGEETVLGKEEEDAEEASKQEGREQQQQQNRASEALFLAEGSEEEGEEEVEVFEDALAEESVVFEREETRDNGRGEESREVETIAVLQPVEAQEYLTEDREGVTEVEEGEWEEGVEAGLESYGEDLSVEDDESLPFCQEPFPIGLVDSKDCGSDTTIFEFGPSLDDDLSEQDEGLQDPVRAAKRRKAQQEWEEGENTDFVFVNGLPELDEDEIDGSGLEKLVYPEEGSLSSKEKAGTMEAPQKQLLLQVGVSSLPHPLKASRGGEDAFLVEGNWLGVADGISTWAEQGVNSGLYSRELLWNCVDVVRTSWELLGVCPKPASVIEESHSRTDLRGSCTITLAVVEGQTLRVANIGDSGFLLLRVGDSVLESERMSHGVCDPYQIGCNFGDDPSCAMVYEAEVQHGDVILLATDGLFDNIFTAEIVRELRDGTLEARDPELVAKRLATLAQKAGECETGDSPFAEWSRSQGQAYEGGKREDVTVIVAYVQDPELM